ncbi:MAG: hypothetical protein ABH986_02815 [archaeon]
MNKGQAISIDLFFAIAIVFLIFFAFISQNRLNNSYSIEQVTEKEMKRIASSTANNLVMTKGFPENWQAVSDVNIIGLVNERRVINEEKLEAFLEMGYGESVEKLGILGYNYYFSIEQDGFTVKEKFDDTNPSYLSNSEKVVSIKRVVEYNGEISEIYFKIYG